MLLQTQFVNQHDLCVIKDKKLTNIPFPLCQNMLTGDGFGRSSRADNKYIQGFSFALEPEKIFMLIQVSENH